MTPTDWFNLAQACLPRGSNLEWRAQFGELAEQQAFHNAAAGNAEWNEEMLTAQGEYAQQQTHFPLQVYDQINNLTINAWKTLPEREGTGEALTKILQGPSEPFSDFLAWLLEAAERVLDNPEVAMPLIKQLAFEQCTRECCSAIVPVKQKGLKEWMKVCRDLGDPLTNAGLAAAILQLNRKGENRNSAVRGCFRCGKQGHLKHNCPEGQGAVQSSPASAIAAPPGICP